MESPIFLFPHSRCNTYCKNMDNCLSNNSIYVRCVTDIVVNSLCYVSGVINMILQESEFELYKKMLYTANDQILSLAVWVEKIQEHNRMKNNNDNVKQRIFPRLLIDNVTATINEEKYPIKDIGLKGCFIKMQAIYPVETILKMGINIGEGIVVTAKIKHCTEQGIGVEFIEMNKDDEKVFLQYMMRMFLEQQIVKTSRKEDDILLPKIGNILS